MPGGSMNAMKSFYLPSFLVTKWFGQLTTSVEIHLPELEYRHTFRNVGRTVYSTQIEFKTGIVDPINEDGPGPVATYLHRSNTLN